MTDDELKDALHELARQAEIPAELEERVVARLREERLLRSPNRSLTARRLARRAALSLAASIAAVALFAGGYAAGSVARHPQATHILFVHRMESRGEHDPERTREYAAWAHHLAAGGEELGGEGWILGPAGTSYSERNDINGYFLLRADSDAEALGIAKTCPHLRHGGRLELRRIER